jgi:hypothetical protein
MAIVVFPHKHNQCLASSVPEDKTIIIQSLKNKRQVKKAPGGKLCHSAFKALNVAISIAIQSRF